MPNSTALLVIDVQMGAFDGERCAVIPGADQLLENVARLVSAVRVSDVELIFIQHCAPTGEVYEEGSAQWLFHPDIAPADTESIVRKRHSSAFEETDLHEKLTSLHIDSLIVCGLQSEHCVSNTTFSARELDYKVTVVRDAHSTWPDAGLSAEQLVERQNGLLAEKGAVLRSTDQVIDAIRVL